MIKLYKLRDYDFRLVIALVVLTSIGVLLVGSADASLQNRQLMGMILGLIVMVVVSLIDFSWILNFYWILYFVNILLLLAVRIAGKTTYGATRWISIGPLQFQPTELSKIILILFFARFLMDHENDLNTLKTLAKSILLIAVPLILIKIQPDLKNTITVAVLPEAEEVDVEINPADIEMQVFRSSGAGGQHINKTSSAVRLIHKPTGMVVECQQERSQFQNRDKAMRLLASRLYEIEREKQDADIARERKSQVGSGDRSEKIRTYNFPQGRVTDHRIGLTLYRIDAVLNGDLDELIDALVTADQAEKLKSGGETT